jgi:hypothetical protein
MSDNREANSPPTDGARVNLPPADAPASNVPPNAIDINRLPPSVAEQIPAEEQIYYADSPIRRAGGIGVWLIFGAGVLYVPASLGAFSESVSHFREADLGMGTTLLSLLLLLGCILFILFAVILLGWPILSELHRRRTFVIISSGHVYKMLQTPSRMRVSKWPVLQCNEPSVARRRGPSATLVLKEHLHQRQSDGRMVYRWVALHGLPNPDTALEALLFVRKSQFTAASGDTDT